MYTDTSRNVIWSLPFLASLAFAQTSRGCYKIDSSLSSLGSYAYQSTGYCLTQCSGSRSAVFALTAGDQCLCGNSLPAGGSVDSSNCNIACTGYPSDNCGGTGYASVWLTGVGTLSGSAESSSEAAAITAATSDKKTTSTTAQATTTASPTTTAAPSVIYITTAIQGSTITQTLSAARTSGTSRASNGASTLNQTNASSSGGGGISGGAIAGIVIGILAAVAITGLIMFFILRRRQSRKEDSFAGDYKRQIEPASGGQMRTNPIFDTRLEPNLAARRNSSESLADDQDYSRRKVLRVVN